MIGILAIVLFSFSMSPAQQIKDEANIMALEKQAWDAFAKGDGKFYETLMADEAIYVGDYGFSTKAQIVKDISSKPCEVKSYSFSNFKVTMLNTDTALVTYESTQDSSCGGQKVPSKVYNSSMYVKRKGKWQAIFHQETTAAEPAPAK